LDIETLKIIGDGKKLPNEIMFGTSENIGLVGKLFIISQSELKFKCDEGIKTRLKQLSFNHRFLKEDHDDYHLIDNKTIFKADKTLCEKLEGKYAMAFLNVLFEYGKMYLEEKQYKKIPEFFAEKTRQTLKNNDVINEWWEDNIEFGNEYKLTKDEINQKRGGIALKEIMDFIKDKKFEYVKDGRHNGMRGIYNGLRLME